MMHGQKNIKSITTVLTLPTYVTGKHHRVPVIEESLTQNRLPTFPILKGFKRDVNSLATVVR